MLSRADDLATMTVLDEAGNPVEVGTLWRDRTAVIVFLRHFGCIHCREHVAELDREASEMKARGAELHVIGNGTPNFIAGFRDQTGYHRPIYVDPSLTLYRAAELKRGVVRTMDPRGIAKGVKAFFAGHRQTVVPQGDQWQQGGVLVVAPTGDVRFQHASERPGDHAAIAQILASI